MASFGGTVKLTGESEYRKALTRITQNLKETSSALTLVDSQYAKNDNSIATVTAKNEKLNSILEKQKNAYNNLKSSFDTIKGKYDEQINSHNKLQAEYDDEKAKLEKLKNTVGESSTAYEKQKEKVGNLATQLNKSQQNIDANEVAMSKLRIQMNNAETSINKTSKEIDNLGKETKDTTNDVKKASDGFTVFKGVLADLSSKAIQSAISGLKKLGSAVIDVGKQAISSYAEYEQLVGGVETLFKDSADIVKGYANQAYKTAGLSANQYMETVTSFSASLLQGLGGDTKKAAQIADMAIIDMSDNANKMGTSMEMIQNAYQGFAKQNYTMLDNLKLGYGGTKEEMARLVKESGILGEAGADLTAKNLDQKVSYDQIVQAIHKVQENMGIAGTTSKEASSTIEGSVNQMKASWQNLLTAIADNNKDIEKSVNEFVDSAITASKNLVPRIKVAVEGIKKLINSIVTEVFPKLKKEIPQLRPLIEVFEWFIKHKNTVINAVKLIITAFAVNKIAKFTKSISDGAKGLLEWVKNATLATTATNANTTAQVANTTSQVAGTTATKALTVATNLLNAAWKSNPIGLVITGVTALISVFSIFKGKTDELTEAEKKQKEALENQTEAVKNQVDAWKDLKQAKQDQIDAGMTEISYYQNLRDELENITDANGNVLEGNEKRASFIVSTLADALGVEIDKEKSLNDQVRDLTSNIDDLMQKKKAQIILDSQEDLYAQAINNKAEATRQLSEVQDTYNKQKEKQKKLEDELAELSALAIQYANDPQLSLGYAKQIQEIQKKIDTQKEEVTTAEKNYYDQLNLVQEYAYNMGLYETNMSLAHEGRYNEMSTVNWSYVKDYQNSEDAKMAQLEQSIKDEQTWLDILKGMRNDSNAEQIDGQIKTSETKLKNLEEEMKAYKSTTEKGLSDVSIVWSDGLDDQLSEITGSKIEFKDAGNGQVQAYVDGVKVGEPKATSEMAKMTTDAINEVSKQKTGATTAGEDLIDGINNGVGNERKQSGVFGTIKTFGYNLLASLKASLQEHSPSKATNQMGQYLLEGLGLGMEKEEDSILKQASNFGKSVIASINGGLSENIKMSAISDIEKGISGININTAKSIAEAKASTDINMVEAFKEALSQMKIEMDDEQMGKFVDITVARTIYS